MMAGKMRFIAGLMGLGLMAGSAMAQTSTWSYEGKTGPLSWQKLDRSYKACGSGNRQSPIEIHHARKQKGLAPVEFHYLSAVQTLVNDGRTVTVSAAQGGYVVVDGVQYQLVSFSFHKPGENTVDGKYDDMDVDLLHKSADGKILIIAIRLKEDIDKPNAVLAALWEHLPKTAGTSDKTTESVSPAGLLPVDRAYWTYDGSLTTPPCTEGVRWIVLREQTTLSRSQLHTYSRLFRLNSRQLQEAHGRKVVASE